MRWSAFTSSAITLSSRSFPAGPGGLGGLPPSLPTLTMLRQRLRPGLVLVLDADENGRDVVLAAGGVGRLDEAGAGLGEHRVVFEDDGYLLVGDEPVEPVGAKQEQVAGADALDAQVEIDRGADAEGAGDHVLGQ